MLAVGELMREEVRVGAGRVRPSALSERQADSRVTNHLSNSQLDEGGDECVGTWVDKQALRVKKGDTCVRRVRVCVHVCMFQCSNFVQFYITAMCLCFSIVILCECVCVCVCVRVCLHSNFVYSLICTLFYITAICLCFSIAILFTVLQVPALYYCNLFSM